MTAAGDDKLKIFLMIKPLVSMGLTDLGIYTVLLIYLRDYQFFRTAHGRSIQ